MELHSEERAHARSLCLFPESPCVHMHEAMWHNNPAVSVMDTTPSGDEYITRGGAERIKTCDRVAPLPPWVLTSPLLVSLHKKNS